jgi:predicted nucleic acid-binding protein
MAAPLVVPDASVILKWVLPPEEAGDIERALALRDAIVNGDVVACVPALWLYEVGNTLARRFPDRVQRALDVLLRFNLTNAPLTARWLRTVLELTADYQVTFYDAAYHAHAINRRGIFVTADERYIQAAGSAGAVSHLSEWT